MANNDTIDKRFGLAVGSPQLVNTIGTTTLYTPASGNRINLKWIAIATPDTNTATVIATITLGGVDIYMWPLPAPGAFMHSSIRMGNIDGILTITLTGAQDVYVNIDIEELK
jgi:hypothetical protein